MGGGHWWKATPGVRGHVTYQLSPFVIKPMEGYLRSFLPELKARFLNWEYGAGFGAFAKFALGLTFLGFYNGKKEERKIW